MTVQSCILWMKPLEFLKFKIKASSPGIIQNCLPPWWHMSMITTVPETYRFYVPMIEDGFIIIKWIKSDYFMWLGKGHYCWQIPYFHHIHTVIKTCCVCKWCLMNLQVQPVWCPYMVISTINVIFFEINSSGQNSRGLAPTTNQWPIFMLKLTSYLFIYLVIMDLTSGQNKENSN